MTTYEEVRAGLLASGVVVLPRQMFTPQDGDPSPTMWTLRPLYGRLQAPRWGADGTMDFSEAPGGPWLNEMTFAGDDWDRLAETLTAPKMTLKEQAEAIRRILDEGPPTPRTEEAIKARGRLVKALESWRRACERGEQEQAAHET